MSIGVVQVRSTIDRSSDVSDTLDMLNLGDVNRFTVVPDEPSYRGMIQKVKDVTAYGEPSASTLAVLLEKRARTQDGMELSQDYVEENTGYNDINELAEALIAGEETLGDVGLQPTISLHPPRGGYGGTKRSHGEGGVLGNHGDEIDELLLKMR